MYPLLLAIHSIIRWVILLLLPATCIAAVWNYKKGLPYTRTHERMRLITTLALHTQLIIGLLLYILSPIVRYFLEHTREAMHLREIRFFGMEHISVMVVAIAVLTHGVIRIKKQPTDTARHRATAIWFTIALIMILSSVPWPFSPLIARPWLRL